MRHTFQAEQWLPYSVEQVFAFFSNPENLPRLMPKWQKARIEEASFAPPPARPTSTLGFRFVGVVAGAGTKLTISFKPFPYSPFRIPWDAEITEFAWNDHFCDVQHRGPFAYWHHCHRLHAETRTVDGAPILGTLLTDEVNYELPLGALGEFGRRLLGERQFKSMFDYRHKRTAELLPMMLATRIAPANQSQLTR
jgi:ligand-binding SRPBCC domain-containing protein